MPFIKKASPTRFLAKSVPLLLAMQWGVNAAYATAYTTVSGGNWGNPAVWGGSGFPDSPSDTATIANTGGLILANSSGVDSSFTINAFSSSSAVQSNSSTISNVAGGSGFLIFDNGASSASLTSIKTSNNNFNINVGVELRSNLLIAARSSAMINFNRPIISGTGFTTGITIVGSSGTATTGAGTVTIGSSTHVSSYTGNTTINGNSSSATTIGGGKLQIGIANALPSGTVLTVNNSTVGGSANTQGAQFKLNGLSQTIAGLSGGSGNTAGTSSGIVASDKTTSTALVSTLTINNTNDYTYSGRINDVITSTNFGTVALAKTGAGTQTLDSSLNGYSGGTTINGGTLVAAAGATASALTGNTTASSATITVSSTAGLVVGQPVTGTDIPAGTRISKILNGTQLVLTRSATATGSGSTINFGTGSSLGTGAVAISSGTLLVSSTGSLEGTGGVTIQSGGTLRYNSSTAYSGTLVNNGGTIGGTGTLNVALALDSVSDRLAPGNSPGIQPFGVDQTWSSFTYEWEVNDFTGTTAGTAFDQIALTDTLTNPSLTLDGGLGAYVLKIVSLDALNNSGLAPNFSETTRQWNIITAEGGLNFNASSWSLDTSSFANAHTGTFSLSSDANNIYLNYTVVPEPSVAGLMGLGLAGLCMLRRKRVHFK